MTQPEELIWVSPLYATEQEARTIGMEAATDLAPEYRGAALRSEHRAVELPGHAARSHLILIWSAAGAGRPRQYASHFARMLADASGRGGRPVYIAEPPEPPRAKTVPGGAFHDPRWEGAGSETGEQYREWGDGRAADGIHDADSGDLAALGTVPFNRNWPRRDEKRLYYQPIRKGREGRNDGT